MNRLIGIRHLRNSPTEVFIESEGTSKHQLSYTHQDEDERAELDFLLEQFVVEWEKVDTGTRPEELPEHHIRDYTYSGEDRRKIPSSYEGFKEGDIVLMSKGGSGDYLAYALSRQAELIGAQVLRVPPHELKAIREKNGTEEKGSDAQLLVELFERDPDLFSQVATPDREIIRISRAWENFRDAQKERIACEQRIQGRMVGRIFCDPEGRYPEGSLDKRLRADKANNTRLQALKEEEKKASGELEKAVQNSSLYRDIFEPIEEVGPRTAAPIIARVKTASRFHSAPAFKKVLGAHLNADGSFPQLYYPETWEDDRVGWDPKVRSRLYLLMGNWLRNPGCHWEQKYRKYKQNFREKYEEELESGEMSDGYIHARAKWRTISRFARWLYRAWTSWEEEHGLAESPA